METPEGKERYDHEFRSLLETVFNPESITNRVDEIVSPLRSALGGSEFKEVQAQAGLVKDRIRERHRQLCRQLSPSQIAPLAFTNGTGSLTSWNKADIPNSGRMDQMTGPNGRACLHIQTFSEASPSWRTKAQLQGGHYRFEGRVRVSGAKPLGFGAHQGAALRIAGNTRQSQGIIGDSEWCLLAEDFQVDPSGAEVEFICEFRASKGEAWFESDSLRVVQQP